MNISRKRLYIGGMTCVNCQNKIERALKKTPGIESAKICYQKGTADIAFDPDWVTLEEIQTVIQKEGYEVLQEPIVGSANFSRAVKVLFLIGFLYWLLQDSGILNRMVPSRLADSGMGYGMLFVIGLLTSVHCIAMCGGINLSQCIGQEIEGKNGLEVFRPSLFYNLGRVISYTGIGCILGFLGMLAGGSSQAGLPLFFQGILKMIAGCFMVIMGVNMLGIFPWLRRFQLRIPQFLIQKVNRKKAGSRQPFAIGLLNGLMPCGPLQSMQIVALASGNPFSGALSMFMFSLGTVPLMLGLGSFVTILGKRFAKKVMESGAVLVVVLGLAMLSQGSNLSGLFYGITDKEAEKEPQNQVSEMEQSDTADSSEIDKSGNEEVQVIYSTLTGGRYPNITVKANIPVKWIIDVPAGALNGCNYRMILNEYGITHTFSEGENIIEFTPEKTGKIPYTCWMGMIRASIFVTDETDAQQAALEEMPQEENSGYENAGMGCCGGF